MTRQEVLDLCIRVACDLNCERDQAWMENRDKDYDRLHAMSEGACEVFDAIAAAWPVEGCTLTILPTVYTEPAP